MEKLIFKTDKNTMGDFKYVGFRKWVENRPAMGTDLNGNFVLINRDEYLELGFVDKPDIKNWKNEIGKEEFEKGEDGTLLGCGKYKDIKLLLKTHSNFTPIGDAK